MSSEYKISSRDELEKKIREFSKRYFPNTTADYSDFGFNSLLFGILSYIGEKILFYQDYYINEKFLSTAGELESVLRHAKREGYNLIAGGVATGTVQLYVEVPADEDGPMQEYIPILLSGSVFYAENGVYFTLNNDVDFNKGKYRVGSINNLTGVPESYIIEMEGEVTSGRVVEEKVFVDSNEQFVKVYFGNKNVAEVLRVTDSESNEYYEVDNLTQNIIYKKSKSGTLYPVASPYRYVFGRDGNGYYLLFGSGSEIIDFASITRDVQNFVTVQGKNYGVVSSFDPFCLIRNDKFGINPVGKELTIVYRSLEQEDVNVGVGGLSFVVDTNFRFNDTFVLDENVKSSITKSLECYNKKPIIGKVYYEDINELKNKVIQFVHSQRRAVSYEDYMALSYSMPKQFGAIKRCSVTSSYVGERVYVNLYVASSDDEGKLTKATDVIKNNLYEWLRYRKVISDNINIFDLNIVNLGLNYTVIVERGFNKLDVLKRCNNILWDKYSVPLDGGQELDLITVYKLLTSVSGVVDVSMLNVIQKFGDKYSSYDYNLYSNLTGDGKVIKASPDVVFEFRYVQDDINGTAI